MIRGIAYLMVALNANTRPGEIAAGAACGVLLALIPGGNLLWIALGLLRLVVPLVDPLLDAAGWAVLTAPCLQEAFSVLQGTPFVPLTRFNHTLVMGGLLAGVVLWVPVFLVFRGLAGINRTRLRERIAGSRFAKAIGRIPLVSAVGKAVQAISSALPSAG